MDLWMFSNDIENSKKYIESGVTHICIDLEIEGKAIRQINRNTFISSHTFLDLKKLSNSIGKEKCICRINKFSERTISEIDQAINYGAGSIILPYFHDKSELYNFINLVNSRARTIALFETVQSFMRIPDMVNIPGLDHIHIGLNDLSIQLDFDDMFEIVKYGWMEILYKNILKNTNIKFGFGGISSINDSGCIYSARQIAKHHANCKSDSVILSRKFFSYCKQESISKQISYWSIINSEIKNIRSFLI